MDSRVRLGAGLAESRGPGDYRKPIIGTRTRGSMSNRSNDEDAFLPLKPAHFHILLSVSAAPMHGYGIRREVEERTGGRIVLAAGTLYETLQRLETRGLIEETDVPRESEAEASVRWRFYRVTLLGRRVLSAEVARLEADVAAARATIPVPGEGR